jgi:hypothetical protein
MVSRIEKEKVMTTTSASLFPCWAIVEVMGHQRYAGMVHEQQVAGVGMVRIDVPDVPQDGRCVALEAYTKLIGVGSIYALTPCTEEAARRFAAMARKRAFELYDTPRISYDGPSASHDEDDEDDGVDWERK